MTETQLRPPRARFWTAERRSGLLDLAIVVAVVLAISVAVKIVWPGFTYWGDNANSYFPLWHLLGSGLREGEYLLFDHSGWAGANVVGEAAYGVFNPVTLANAVLVSLFDNLARASFVVMAEFLAILAVGVYMLARVYGATRAPSVIAAIVFPFAGYTLFYEAGNWASGLMSITWVVHFWWSARAYTSGRIGPLPAVLFGGLAATVGNPYAVLGVIVVLLGLAVELLLARDLRRLGGLVVAGACVGLIVLFVYLPLINVMPQIDRPTDEFVDNSNYLAPSLSDLFGMSSPGYLPRMDAWATFGDFVPSTYLSWIILPLLPWLRWSSLAPWRRRAGLFVSTTVFLLFTLGPDKFWQFRWPIRLIEYSYVGVAVLFALLLSAGLAHTHTRRRAAATAAIVVSVFFISWSSSPSLWGFHLLMTALVGALVAAVFLAHRRWAGRGIIAIVIIGTAVIAPLQAKQFGWNSQVVGLDVDQSIPPSLQTVRDASEHLDGTVLQVANIVDLAGDGSVFSGRINFGNTAAAAGTETVNRYTGIHLLQFKNALAMDFRGSIGEELTWETLFTPVPGAVDVPLIDLLGIDTLVVSTARTDIDELRRWDDGWHVAEEDDVRIVLQRDDPIPSPALSPSEGVTVLDASEDGNDVRFGYESEDGGTVVLDRLAWNGYSATADGEELELSQGVAGLIEIELPPGTHEVAVTYEIPGLRLGLLLLAIALAIAVLHEVLWRISWLRRKRSWTPEIVDSGAMASSFTI